MELNDKDIRKIVILGLILGLAVLVFIVIRPVLLSIIGGLILAYIFMPINKQVLKYVRERNTSAAITSIIAMIIVFVPLWFIAPIIVQQVFEIFKVLSAFDSQSFIQSTFPTASESFITQTTVTFNNLTSKIASGLLTTLIDVFLNLGKFLLNVAIIGFVFFFTLRDSDKLGVFMSEISPLNKNQEKPLIKQFKDITDSLLFGQVVIGLAQGIVAGVGFLIFGVPNALFLTALAVVMSIIPLVGPGLVWIPITIIMFASGQTTAGVLFLIYNGLITSTIDNFLRPYIVARRTNLSTVIILVGMIGGLIVFGILGLILGPLILAYFLTLLKAYKQKTLSELFQA